MRKRNMNVEEYKSSHKEHTKNVKELKKVIVFATPKEILYSELKFVA